MPANKLPDINVYVTVAPTYPECDAEDLHAVLKAMAEIKPAAIFHEPINIRAENITRIQSLPDELGGELKTDALETREAYAVNVLQISGTLG